MERGEQPRFLCDVMLGKLSRWLRFLGYDTEYFHDADDSVLLRRAGRTGRILLTRDTALHQRASRAAFLVACDGLHGQLRQLREAGLVEIRGEGPGRCPGCNGLLRRAGPQEVERKVPDHVLQRHDSFTLCADCGRVYWQGSHLRGIAQVIAAAMK